MVRVKHCAVLILYCIYQLLNVSLAAPQNSWRADHDTHKLPGNIKHQQKHQLQHPKQQQKPQQQQPQQGTVYQSVTPAMIDNVYNMGADSNNAVNVVPVNVATENHNEQDSVNVQARDYFTVNRIEKPRVLEQSDKRFDDGHYEYSYTLSNGDTRYERAYWLPAGSEIILARKGFYSYPVPDNKFYTVFYTSDQNGFQQDSSTFSKGQPTLPKSVTVPEHPVSLNQHGVIQHPNNVVSETAHNHNNNVVPQGVQHWNSHGTYKRVRKHVNEQKIEEAVDKIQSITTTEEPQIQLSRTTESVFLKSENLQQATPQPTVELPSIDEVSSLAQQRLVVYAQQPNVQSPADLRDPTYNTQIQQNAAIGQGQQIPVGGTYLVPNVMINTLNKPTSHGPILGQHQPQQPLTQQQQILNQNALINYLASRISAESPESYSEESHSHELYLPGLLGGNNQLPGYPNQLPNALVLRKPSRRRIRGNVPTWPLSQQQIAQHLF